MVLQGAWFTSCYFDSEFQSSVHPVILKDAFVDLYSSTMHDTKRQQRRKKSSSQCAAPRLFLTMLRGLCVSYKMSDKNKLKEERFIQFKVSENGRGGRLESMMWRARGTIHMAGAEEGKSLGQNQT